MRKFILAFAALLTMCGCKDKDEWHVSKRMEAPYLYWDEYAYDDGGDGGYVTFERYMWQVGFPDSIIVKVTRDGKFLGYDYAYRRDVIKDSLGVVVGPAYVIGSVVGDNIVYNLKGEFVEWNECVLPHSGQGEPDHVWRP